MTRDAQGPSRLMMADSSHMQMLALSIRANRIKCIVHIAQWGQRRALMCNTANFYINSSVSLLNVASVAEKSDSVTFWVNTSKPLTACIKTNKQIMCLLSKIKINIQPNYVVITYICFGLLMNSWKLVVKAFPGQLLVNYRDRPQPSELNLSRLLPTLLNTNSTLFRTPVKIHLHLHFYLRDLSTAGVQESLQLHLVLANVQTNALN